MAEVLVVRDILFGTQCFQPFVTFVLSQTVLDEFLANDPAIIHRLGKHDSTDKEIDTVGQVQDYFKKLKRTQTVDVCENFIQQLVNRRIIELGVVLKKEQNESDRLISASPGPGFLDQVVEGFRKKEIFDFWASEAEGNLIFVTFEQSVKTSGVGYLSFQGFKFRD